MPDPNRPDQPARSPIQGVALAVVTDNTDPDRLGRVKLLFPWLAEHRESGWARIAVLMAGPERGTYFLPEVGDEVLVAFEHGDLRRPYVIGALWNGKDKPPAGNDDGENHTRRIRSRSGHELTMFDKSGQETVELKTRGGHTLRMEDRGRTSRITLADGAGSNFVTIDSDTNAITIQSAASLTVKSQAISIEAGASLTIKAAGTLTLQGALVRIN